MQNQFKATIQIVRSDNALEFKDAACTEFFQKHGIVHQTSCNYRPQQNVRVERKHRHVLEVARALMFQSGLSVTYWGESVLTAAYIINRLPSSVLKNKCPYEMLHNKPVNYDELRSFGCLAFASNPVHSTDKLLARGVPCIFLGYSPTQKGYRLLDLKTMKMFVSRDVTFNETIFPLNSTTPKPYMLPLPTTMPTPMPSSVSYGDDEFLYKSTVEPTSNLLNEPLSSHSEEITQPENNVDADSEPTQTDTTENAPRRSTRTHKPPS